jgi:hypothetical protein
MEMQARRALLLAYGAAAIAAALPADAAFTTFTNAASFQGAAGSLTLEDFNSTAPSTLANPAAPSFSTPFGGFALSGNANGDFVAVAAGSNPGNTNGTNFLYWSQLAPGSGTLSGDGNVGPQFTFTFSSARTAFGFDWTDTDSTDAYQIAINGVTFSNPPFAVGGTGSGFFGVLATGGETFTTVTFTQNAAGGIVEPFGLDNLRFTAAATGTVPEPGSISLVAAALLAGAGAWKRRRKKA